MLWRRLHPGETDHELVWLCVSVASAGLAAFWLTQGLPWPECAFHHWTGWPCPACGLTRCFKLLLAGDWTGALRMNPLGFLGALGVLLFDLYALVVLAGRLPRLRPGPGLKCFGLACRLAAIALIGSNWAWLLVRGT